MNAEEAGQLLALLSAIDRREVDKTTAQGWAWALHDIAFPHALEAARKAMDTGAYVDVNAIKTAYRTMRPRLEADVRSAKLRGLIPDTWPKSQPLTAELEQQLRDRQAVAWARTNDRPEQITGPGVGIDLGRIGKDID